MTARMKAMVLRRTGLLREEEIAVPAPEGGQLLVRVAATGICGSDLAAFNGSHPYKRPPMVPGHEMCGTVVQVGTEVSGFAVGDLVCSAAYSHCGKCGYCLEGTVNRCTGRRNIGDRGWPGTFGEYAVLEQNMAFVLPPGTAPAVGALVEPLATAVHAVSLLPTRRPRSLLVVGSGTIGLGCVLAARGRGIEEIACVDRGPGKAALATGLGADYYIDAESEPLAAAVDARLGGPADAAIVAAGYERAVADAVGSTARGGTAVVVSYFAGPAVLDANDLVAREISLAGSALATPADFEAVIAGIAAGSLDPAPIVTHILPLSEAQRGMELLASDRTTGKVMLDASS
ncbi:alcohol dehydrogenase catalytic domain-containing protein [Streptomonospora sp. PA3]|uniref:alcohol dehydrogenase catalytic domain-containing protein n=1 Tax=Streptomonospora sp. PA3 TaxID=2607326 RepID=UPI001642812B